jgi:hypothetical protein
LRSRSVKLLPTIEKLTAASDASVVFDWQLELEGRKFLRNFFEIARGRR